MRKTKNIKIDDKEIVVKELTVAQVDELFNEKNPVGGTTVDLLMGDDATVPVKAVTLSTGLTYDEMAEMPPSDLKTIWIAVEELNDFLCQLLRKLAQNITTAAVIKES
jgi:hypothetical protein